MGLLLIVSQIGLAGVVAQGESSTAVATLAGVYAGSSLLGYFNNGDAPILSLSRLNINSGLLSAALVVS